MSAPRPLQVALVGNPNAGKTSLFNRLTGMSQKVGNFPGVTVERKSGQFLLPNGQPVRLTDLPGTYSLYPKSYDERVAVEVLLEAQHPDRPKVVVVIVDESNLKRNLLLTHQLYDLGLPLVIALNMGEMADKKGSRVPLEAIEEAHPGSKVVEINARDGRGLDELKAAIQAQHCEPPRTDVLVPSLTTDDRARIGRVQELLSLDNPYQALLTVHHLDILQFLPEEKKAGVLTEMEGAGFDSSEEQSKETLYRYHRIDHDLGEHRDESKIATERWTRRLDKILVHRVWGFLIFLLIMALMFQTVFALAAYPMDWIDQGTGWLSVKLLEVMPSGWGTDLLVQGLLAGIGGVVIFVPQIALLFLLLGFLEESGYMARVMYITDKLMRPFGLNGRSVVPLISGLACAIPAIMAARSIENRKERLLTIFVTPLMSCSARLPVYAVLIALVVPNERVGGVFSLQGLAMMGMYLLGVVFALLTAIAFKGFFKRGPGSLFVMEMPDYRWPQVRNVLQTMWLRSRAFVFEAGKVIVPLAILLWFLASYGPGDSLERAEATVIEQAQTTEWDEGEVDNRIAAAQMEASYAGRFGKAIEPAIRPLGYDWKIGIALLTSFAAREVFVGTINTIYTIGADVEETSTIKERLARERDPATGEARFTVAVAFSLMVFYAFALQCMSTVAIVWRETRSWAIVTLQWLYMAALAYGGALLTYQLLS